MDIIRRWSFTIYQSVFDKLSLGMTVYHEDPSEIPDITNK